MNTKNCVYQFVISLRDISPVIWRRIQVPTNYNFWEIHVAIQDSMGWLDYHLHQFTIKRPHAHKITNIGIPDDEGFFDDIEVLPGWEINISNYFTRLGVSALYTYDFGDNWEHDILLEGLMLRRKGIKYPICTGGERKCPPEDCGSVPGYFYFLEAVLDPTHEQHEEMIEWYGEKYVPNDFNPQNVRFDNPGKRWRIAFQNG